MPRFEPSLSTPESRYSVPPKPDFASQMFFGNFALYFLLGRAAGVVADDPVDIALEHRFPERLDVGARANRRVHLRRHAAGAIGIEQQMPDRDLPLEIDVREGVLHHQRRIHRLPRREVQQVDVEALGFVGEIGRDPDREPLGVRRPGGAVGREPVELAVALDELRISVEDVGELAMQADADVVGQVRMRGRSCRFAERMMNSKCATS